jgi:chitinase
VYATKTYVITACPPEVVNCPVGQVTTEVTSYTTVCPVTPTETIPKATGPAGDVPVEGGFNIKATSSLRVVSVSAPSGLATSTRPAAATLVPAPPTKGCLGPECPVENHVAIPSIKSVWSNGTHTEAPSSYSASSYGQPTSAYATPSSTYSEPSETPAVPATGGASGLAISVTGFLAVAALQVLFL